MEDSEQKRVVILKRLRKGAFECGDFLVIRRAWTSERWDGPRETFRRWTVFQAGSNIERRVLLDRFLTLDDARRFVERMLSEPKPIDPNQRGSS
jgi:hypothetical protein